MTEASNMEPCCGNCRYSVVGSTQLELACHRYAPKPDVTGWARKRAIGRWAAWPLVASSDWCGEWAPPPDDGSGPSITPEAIARFLAHSDSIPALDGMTVLPSPEEQPAPAEPEFLTYDQPFEDPLQ